jgi:hypothetical protein
MEHAPLKPSSVHQANRGGSGLRANRDARSDRVQAWAFDGAERSRAGLPPDSRHSARSGAFLQV